MRLGQRWSQVLAEPEHPALQWRLCLTVAMAVVEVMAACCLGQMSSTPCAPTSPLATLAHLGEPGESGGVRGGVSPSSLPGRLADYPKDRGGEEVGGPARCGVGQLASCQPARSPATPRIGEMRWRGARRFDRTASLWSPPAKGRGGGQVAERASVCGRGGSSITKVCSKLMKVSSELTKVAAN